LQQAEFLKINQEFEKQLSKWNEDTAKVIKVFNESFGLSYRALIHSELSDELFVAAWKKLDVYYNTTEAIDTSSLMTYCTLTYNPKWISREVYRQSKSSVFTIYNSRKYDIRETKLGIVRGALDKGSNRYKDVLKMCKFSKFYYNDTLNRLHEFDVEIK
jgi:hypothetical protein